VFAAAGCIAWIETLLGYQDLFCLCTEKAFMGFVVLVKNVIATDHWCGQV
jgi:hypothetical protein